VAFSAVNCLFAQDPGSPSGKFYGPIISGSWQVKIPRAGVSSGSLQAKIPRATVSKNFMTPPPATSPCSIPLLGAQIPKDVDYKIKQVAPPTEKLAPMPQVQGPAPTCESWSGR